jgi:hypothetical protein
MEEIKLIINPFEMGTEKEAANKVQEEANEAVHAWRSLVEDEYPTSIEEKMNASIRRHVRLADEIADVIQAACNLAVRYGIDLQAAMWRCERRNRERGRYEDEDAKPCGIRDGHDCNCGGYCGAVSVGVGFLRQKSPEEMSVEELYEMLRDTNSFDCRKTVCDDWCECFDDCYACRERLLNLLKEAHERESETAIELIKDGRDEYMRLRTENGIMLDELLIRQDKMDKLNQQVSDLAHERDGLRNRLAELSEAGITGLHRLLREAVGEAKNVTDNARVYINKKQESKDERCGDCGSIGRDHGGDCGAERVGEHLLPVEPPSKEMSEREAVIERLRKLDFAQEKLYLNDIGCAVLGRDPASWWSDESRAALRDKLIELIGDVNDAG